MFWSIFLVIQTQQFMDYVMQKDNQMVEGQVGWEVICESTECVHNETPVCKIHKPDMPIVIKNGKCRNYQKRDATDNTGWFYDNIKGSSQD